MAAAMDLSEFEQDPRLFLFTSLTAGSSHIITATSRLETILKANKIPFQAIDTATDEKARRLWQRRAQQRKLPGLVKAGFVIGDLDAVEEWNEFGELKENIGAVPASGDAAAAGARPGVNIRPPDAAGHVVAASPVPDVSGGTTGTSPPPAVDNLQRVALPGAAEIEARSKQSKAAALPAKPLGGAPAVESITTAPAEKESSINAAKEISKHHPSLDHLSAPASQIHSETATPPSEAVAPAEGVGGATSPRQHRGSEVLEAPEEEIKRVESESALQEDPDEDAEELTTKGVGKITFQEPEKPAQEQDAREGGDAVKSVED